MSLIYGLFSLLDYSIYTLCSWILLLIFDIASYDFFTQEIIQEFTSRVYIILGVVMLFKIVVSCIQYLINPDKTDDKENGLGAILKRTVICVALLAFVPSVFKLALEAQDAIADSIPKIVLGESSLNDVELATVGDEMAFTTLTTFIKVKEGKSGGVGKDEEIHDFDSFLAKASKGCGIFSSSGCVYNYTILLSTITGGFLLYVLISMALDVAIRTIKLGILQLIAPVPIASYIDPKSSKTSFDVWVKTSITVYCDLFIRFVIIYFIIYFVKIILKAEYVANIYDLFGAVRGSFVLLFMILGLLMFAKSAPKFLCDILGIKDSGNFKDMFTRAGGLAGTTVGGLRTARSNYRTQMERLNAQAKKGAALRAALSSASGFGSAAARGIKSSLFDNKGYKDVRRSSSSAAIKARDARNDRYDNIYSKEPGNEYGWLDYHRDKVRADLGIPSDNKFIKVRYDTMEQTAKIAADAKGHGTAKMNETPGKFRVKLKPSDANDKVIIGDLGYDELTMEKARNMYALAKNGQDVERKDGTKIRLNSDQMEALGQVVQSIEKKTSYLKEAELMSTADPGALGYLEKLKFIINSNKAFYNNEKDIMNPIIRQLASKGISVTSIDDVIGYLEGLSTSTTPPPTKPSDYGRNPASTAAYDASYETWEKLWQAEIAKRADVIFGVKDAFERLAASLLPQAQQAEVRAKKEEQTAQNASKKE